MHPPGWLWLFKKKKKGNSVKEYVEKLKSSQIGSRDIYNGAVAMKNSSSEVKQSNHMT